MEIRNFLTSNRSLNEDEKITTDKEIREVLNNKEFREYDLTELGLRYNKIERQGFNITIKLDGNFYHEEEENELLDRLNKYFEYVYHDGYKPGMMLYTFKDKKAEKYIADIYDNSYEVEESSYDVFFYCKKNKWEFFQDVFQKAISEIDGINEISYNAQSHSKKRKSDERSVGVLFSKKNNVSKFDNYKFPKGTSIVYV